MTKQIWMLSFNNCNNFKGTSFLCANTVTFAPGGCGVTIVIDGTNTNIAEISAFASVVPSANPAYCPAEYPFYSDTSSACTGQTTPNQPCDCINGGCLPKTTYGTPGVFANLADCIAGCAKNSTCTGECVDPAEIAAHQQAIDNLKAKIC